MHKEFEDRLKDACPDLPDYRDIQEIRLKNIGRRGFVLELVKRGGSKVSYAMPYYNTPLVHSLMREVMTHSRESALFLLQPGEELA